MQPEELLDLVGRIYDASLDPALWPSVLEEICGFVDATAAAVSWQDAFERSAIVLHDWGDDPRYTRSYVETYAAMNPLFPAMGFVEPGIVVAVGDMMPHAEFRQTRFFAEWVAPQGYIDAAAVNLERYATSSAAFSVRRSVRQGIIDAEAAQRLRLLVPHIRRAVLIGRQLAGQEQVSSDLRRILDAAAAGIFLVSESGHLGFVNEAGRELLRRGDVVLAKDGILHARGLQADRRLRDAIGSPPPGLRRTVSVSLTEARPRWLADLLPLSSGQRLNLGREHRAAMAVFVRKAEIPVVSGIEALARSCRLTASEIKVLQEAAGGGSVSEIAEALGLSPATVKTHLGSLFAKTGTSRRADLVREVAAHGGPLV